MLEVLNVFDFPNNVNSGQHPISAYEKWSIPLNKFAADYDENKNTPKKSKYYRLQVQLLQEQLQEQQERPRRRVL